MNEQSIYPYLVPGLIDAGWKNLAIPLGHGLYVTLFRDNESKAGIVHVTVTPDEVRTSGRSPAELHDIALANLQRFARGGDLSIQMLGAPGESVNFLIFGYHARAAACIRLPSLYAQACELLMTNAVCACVPQRKCLIVMPTRDSRYRQAIVAKLIEIEGEARRPLTFGLFDLTPDGVRERED